MKRFVPVLLAILMFLPSRPASAIELKSEEQKTLYAIGLTVSKSLAVFNLTPAEFEVVLQGLRDAQSGKKSEIELSSQSPKIQEFARSRRKATSERQAPANKELLDKASKEKGAVTSASGLVYIPLHEGSGASPKTSDMVKVNYRGILVDGREFESSFKRGKPSEFRVDSVIKCLNEGLQKMKVGGKARLVCPASIGYGDNGFGETILPGASLDFEIELLEIRMPPRDTKPAPDAKATPETKPAPEKKHSHEDHSH